MITAYPLSWPAGWRRTQASDRKRARFNSKSRNPGQSYAHAREITMAEARKRLLDACRMMGIPDYNVVMSTNVELRRDGLPYSGRKAPTDPGAAVYWRDGGKPRCMAIDIYDRVEDNLAALAASLDALRAVERHGGAAILNRAFDGFALEHNQESTKTRTWREILFPNGCPINVTLDLVKAHYRQLASKAHPDRGGSHEAMIELNVALAEAENELRGSA